MTDTNMLKTFTRGYNAAAAAKKAAQHLPMDIVITEIVAEKGDNGFYGVIHVDFSNTWDSLCTKSIEAVEEMGFQVAIHEPDADEEDADAALKADAKEMIDAHDAEEDAATEADETAAKVVAPRVHGQFKGQTFFPTLKSNPRREGSHGERSYQILLDNPGISYEDFVKAGGRPVDLRWDVKNGNASIGEAVKFDFAPIAEAVREYALEHYNEFGWDFIVETMTNGEIAAELAAGAIRTNRAAIAHFRAIASLKAEMRSAAMNEA